MTTNKRIGLLIVKLLIIAVTASVLQLVLWNWPNWSFLLDDTVQKNLVYTLQDFQIQNWTEQNGQMTSGHDPMLMRDGIDGYVRQVRIELEADPLPPYLQVYYTNPAHPAYDGEAVVTAQQVSSITVIDVNAEVQNLRIDLGDDSGTVLTGLTVTVNPVELHFSIAIIVAVILIYFSGKLLFSLQRAPNYGIADIQPDKKKEDDA